MYKILPPFNKELPPLRLIIVISFGNYSDLLMQFVSVQAVLHSSKFLMKRWIVQLTWCILLKEEDKSIHIHT